MQIRLVAPEYGGKFFFSERGCDLRYNHSMITKIGFFYFLATLHTIFSVCIVQYHDISYILYLCSYIYLMPLCH